jgi:dodecin
VLVDVPASTRTALPSAGPKGDGMSVAKISEISSTSKVSFEDAIQQGIQRASKSIRQIKSAWIKEQQVRVENNKITEYQVNLLVTFVLDDQ